MALIYKSDNFLVETPVQPLVSREEGGHIIICPRIRIADRTLLSPKLAIELMYLTLLSGEAMKKGLEARGIPIGRINYQDNGNWGVLKPEGPYQHYHLYGRAVDAVVQKYGEACYFPFPETGFYANVKGLDENDIAAIQQEIEQLLQEKRFQPEEWGLDKKT